MELELTSQNFNDEISKDELILVDFWASWCPPCRAMNPILQDIAQNHKDVARIGKVNVDNEQELAVSNGASSIPTMILFKNGKELGRKVGALPKDALIDFIKSHS